MLKNLGGATLEEDQYLVDCICKDYGKLMMYSGCIMRLTPDTIIFVIVYNVFLFFFLWSSVSLFAYTLLTEDEMEIDEIVYVANLGVVTFVAAICQVSFFFRRRTGISIYRTLSEFEKYRTHDESVVASELKVYRFLNKAWPIMVAVALICQFIVMYILNSLRDDKKWRLPIALKFPFETTDSAGYWTGFSFELGLIYVIWAQLGPGFPAYLFVEKIILELKTLNSLVRTLHSRSLDSYQRLTGTVLKRSHSRHKNPTTKYLYHLNKDPLYTECYERNFRVVIILHQLNIK